MNLPDWIPSSASSDVEAFRYLPYALYGPEQGFPDDVLEIRFRRARRVFRFLGVPEHVYDSFFAASSKGRFVHTVLIPNYAAYQVE